MESQDKHHNNCTPAMCQKHTAADVNVVWNLYIVLELHGILQADNQTCMQELTTPIFRAILKTFDLKYRNYQ